MERLWSLKNIFFLLTKGQCFSLIKFDKFSQLDSDCLKSNWCLNSLLTEIFGHHFSFLIFSVEWTLCCAFLSSRMFTKLCVLNQYSMADVEGLREFSSVSIEQFRWVLAINCKSVMILQWHAHAYYGEIQSHTIFSLLYAMLFLIWALALTRLVALV